MYLIFVIIYEIISRIVGQKELILLKKDTKGSLVVQISNVENLKNLQKNRNLYLTDFENILKKIR